MRQFAILLCLVWAVAQLWLGTARLMAGSSDRQAATQSLAEAHAQDLALVAKGNGWTLAEAGAQHHAAAIIGAIAEQVAAARPDSFVGSALSDEPGGPPTLYVKGAADLFVRSLVDASDIEIVLADNQPYSFQELEARKLRIHHALEAQGFRQVVTGVNITGGGIVPAAVMVEPGLRVGRDEVVAALPADLRSSVELTMSETSIVVDTTSFGGMETRDDGVFLCTSGWTVTKSSTGVTGVTTAGHCRYQNEIVHPGHGVHAFVYQAEHRGQWGDIEWHVTNYAEVDDFYASANDIRDVGSVEARANISVGESVCQYGRASNDRDCTPHVFDVSLACTLEGVFNDRLVQMDVITSTFNDSGGGWSMNFVAFGSQKGWCNSKDTWSVADLYDEALGVTVNTN